MQNTLIPRATGTPPVTSLDTETLDVPVEAVRLDGQYATAFPILQRALQLTLLRRAFSAAQSEEVPTESLAFWHKLLVENAKLPTPGNATVEPTEGANLIELIWDVFVVPEEERAKRRAAFGLQAKSMSTAGSSTSTAGSLVLPQPGGTK